MTEQFDGRIHDRSLAVGVIGLGYVGLPLAVAFANAGFAVVGVDASASRVERVMSKKSPILDVPDAVVAAHVGSGKLCATTDYAHLTRADAVFVCVPTPFDRAKAPDLTFVVDAATRLSAVLQRGQLVLLESTTYPGTTEEELIPILERSGLRAGVDFYVAFSPERIDPGSRTHTIANTPKVVGGMNEESTRRAALLLEQVVREGGVKRVSSPRVAELTKLLENTFRAVNIALVNELAMLCDRMGIDVWEVIDAAKTKPYGFMPFYPGPGVGGHCIPVDPYYLSWKARQFDFSTKFIELAAETNQSMPFFTVDKIRRSLAAQGKTLIGAQILALGAAFKRDVDDARNSAAIRVMEILVAEGADLSYHDPFVSSVRLRDGLYAEEGLGRELRSVPLTDDALHGADLVAILVGHSAIDYGRVSSSARALFDAVNATTGLADGRIVRL
ncbi:MAG: nucleotide sugar dehydrogenase [Chloroflexota bacterium]|nr:nucleotide sugar dehydrogenase [Chloroflexota bacterium]